MRTILTVLLISTSYLSNAQVELYYSHEDYSSKNGQVLAEGVFGYVYVGKKVTCFIKDRTTKEKIECNKLWGFKYKDALFRIYKIESFPVMLVREGKFCYYENGEAHINRLDNENSKSSTVSYKFGDACYLSQSLESNIYATEGAGYIRFKKLYPEYQKLYECLKETPYGHLNESTMRECVADYHSTVKQQTIVYKTYAEFAAKKGTEYTKLLDCSYEGAKCNYAFKQGSKRVEVKGKEIWGFTHKGGLIRVQQHGFPMVLVSNDRVFYYENVAQELGSGYKVGYECYISKGLEDMPVAIRGTKQFKTVISEYSGAENLLDCISKYKKEFIRPCMKEFQDQ